MKGRNNAIQGVEVTPLLIGIQALKLKMTDPIIKKFLLYLALLQKWNAAYNLTTIKLPEKIISHHFLDSLSIYPFLQGNRICDVGCGAGFPGIPLALIYPDKHFYLIESQQKKVSFLIQVVYELDLHNVVVVHQRAENYRPTDCFDAVMTRAFSSLKEMIEKTKHLCCKSGKFLAMKGNIFTDELVDLPKNYQIKAIEKLTVPGLNAKRHLVIIGLDKI